MSFKSRKHNLHGKGSERKNRLPRKPTHMEGPDEDHKPTGDAYYLHQVKVCSVRTSVKNRIKGSIR